MPRTPDEIWADDLLGRRDDATLLIGFIESLFDRQTVRDRGHAYTISVDAPYGVGKSFFLSRLAEELRNSHPVAFVDAWTDDLADEPLIALVSTLKAALGPLLGAPKAQEAWKNFLDKSGKVAGIVTLGLLKRGAGLLVTAPAVEAISGVIDTASEITQGAVADGISSVGTGTIDDLATALQKGPDALAARIAEFEAGQTAIRQMKESLSALVNSLSGEELSPPIVIVIDELDRCRPSYAIKLFEEIKHLFDVPGIVFLFGVHADQLAHSVKWAYGSDFNGAAYLKRFVNRQYTLQSPDRRRLVEFLLHKSAIAQSDFYLPSGWQEDRSRGPLDLLFALNWYVDALDVSPRDLFEFFDLLETSVAIAKPSQILFPFLIPLIVARIKKSNPLELNWKSDGRVLYINRGEIEISPESLFRKYHDLSRLSDSRLMDTINGSQGAYIEGTAGESAFGGGRTASLGDFRRYNELISAVLRFSPKADTGA